MNLDELIHELEGFRALHGGQMPVRVQKLCLPGEMPVEPAEVAAVVLKSPAMGCRPVARATWLNILFWCAQQENGGHISGAKAWSNRQWQQLCGVTKPEVEAAAPLLRWDGDDLVVWNYPTAREAEMRAKREAGRTSGFRSAARSKQGGKQAAEDGGGGLASSAGGAEGAESTGAHGLSRTHEGGAVGGAGAGDTSFGASSAAHGGGAERAAELAAERQRKGMEGNGKEKEREGKGGLSEAGGARERGELPVHREAPTLPPSGFRLLAAAERAVGAPTPPPLPAGPWAAAGTMGKVPTPSLEEVIGYGSGISGSAPRDCCEAWWNDHEARPRHATGGYTDRHGVLVGDWRASLRGFAVRWRANEERDRWRPGSAASRPRAGLPPAPGGKQKFEDQPL